MDGREALNHHADQERGVYLEICEATAITGKPLQVLIRNDRHGHRLAGPKFGASGSRVLRQIKLTPRDADAIRGYLSEITDA